MGWEGHGRGLKGKLVDSTRQEGRPGPALALSTSGNFPIRAAADLVPESWLCAAWSRVWEPGAAAGTAGPMSPRSRSAGWGAAGRAPDSWSLPPFPHLLLGLSVHSMVLTGQGLRREL